MNEYRSKRIREDEIKKYSKRSSKLFIIAYIALLTISVIGFTYLASIIQIEQDVSLLQYIMNGGK